MKMRWYFTNPDVFNGLKSRWHYIYVYYQETSRPGSPSCILLAPGRSSGSRSRPRGTSYQVRRTDPCRLSGSSRCRCRTHSAGTFEPGRAVVDGWCSLYILSARLCYLYNNWKIEIYVYIHVTGLGYLYSHPIELIDYSSIMGKRTPTIENNVTSLARYVTWRHFWCKFWTNRHGR
jgi:hypothetical protein